MHSNASVSLSTFIVTKHNLKSKPVGRIRNGIFLKTIHQRNILRLPEPSFTFDKALVDGFKGQFTKVRVTLKEDGSVWELTAVEFWKLAEVYNYGWGENYRVACQRWRKKQAQLPLQMAVQS